MKKLICLLCAAVLLLSLTGCRSEDSGNPEMKAEVTDRGTVYDGQEQRLYQVEEGQSGTLGVKISGSVGRLSLSVTKEGESFYEGNDLQNCGFSVVLDEPGEYRCLVTAEHFTGEYSLEWSVQ